MTITKKKLFDIPIDTITLKDSLAHIKSTLKKPGFHHITTLNPQIVMGCQSNPSLKQWIKESTLCLPDGIGVSLAYQLIHKTPCQKVAGVDLVDALLKTPDISVYLIGSQEETLNKLQNRIKHPPYQAKLSGAINGYFKENDLPNLIKDIQKTSPDIILVAMGFPKQETLLQTLDQHLNHGIGIGVGGSFDVLSGHINRSPQWVIALGLEWLHRTLQNPKRLKLWPTLFRYFIMVLSNTISSTNRSRT